jgi:zinc transport system substrate-binding protein
VIKRIIKHLIFIAIVSINITAIAKPRIITSIVPLASIVAMLMDNQAEISAIAVTQNCPHHYHIRPSDLQKIKHADIVIYIDDKFDGFIAKIINNHNKNIIRLSNFQSIKFLTEDNQHNWHFWLNLSNVQALLEELTIILVKSFPEQEKHILTNLDAAKLQLDELVQIKATALNNLTDIILLSNNTEHFFFSKHKIYKLYQHEYKSLKYMNNLEQLLANSVNKCIVISNEQNHKLYDKLGAAVIQIDSENWQLATVNARTFYDQYFKLIQAIMKCTDKH